MKIGRSTLSVAVRAVIAVIVVGFLPTVARADWIKGIFSTHSGIDSIDRCLVIRDSDSLQVLGYGIASLGDINGDGHPDLWLSRSGGSCLDTTWSFAYFGGKGAHNVSDRTFSHFSWGLGSIGDINGDGSPDFGQTPSFCGSTYAFEIFDGGTAFDDQPDQSVPMHWSPPVRAVDLLGDTRLELCLAKYFGVEQAPFRRVDIFEITNGIVDTMPVASLSDTTYGFGSNLAVGDFNGDGHSDLAIAARYTFGRGTVSMYWGGPLFDSVPDLVITDSTSFFGKILLPIGDFNGDGFEDILISGGEDAPYGIYFGGPQMDSKVDVIVNLYRGGFGYFPPTSAARAGDINHDGYPDILLGYTNQPASRFEVHLFLGGPVTDTSILADIYIEHLMLPCCTDYLGDNLAGIGDFNGDGVDDFAVRSQTAYNGPSWWGEVNVFAGWNSHPTDVDANHGDQLPDGFELRQNYPNPFNATTQISFSVPKRAGVKVTVTDMLGRVRGTLVDRVLDAGTYKATWDAEKFASGTYICVLEAGDIKLTRKMVLVK